MSDERDPRRQGPRARAADDFDAIRERLTALKSGCSCTVHRGANGDVLSLWGDPDCPLHRDCATGYLTKWAPNSLGDPGAPIVTAVRGVDGMAAVTIIPGDRR